MKKNKFKFINLAQTVFVDGWEEKQRSLEIAINSSGKVVVKVLDNFASEGGNTMLRICTGLTPEQFKQSINRLELLKNRKKK